MDRLDSSNAWEKQTRDRRRLSTGESNGKDNVGEEDGSQYDESVGMTTEEVVTKNVCKRHEMEDFVGKTVVNMRRRPTEGKESVVNWIAWGKQY
ncbi:hypothetical protein ACF0H5_006464 [Mactra antiquata]